MTASVSYLPIWKAGATPEERFLELAMIAQKHPERFAKMVLVYEETVPSGRTLLRFLKDGMTTNEVVGLLQIASVDIIEDSRK